MARALIAWTPLVLLPPLVIATLRDALEPWAFMWALSFATFAGVKWLTWYSSAISAGAGRHLGYLTLWPGLDAHGFLTDSVSSELRPRTSEVAVACGKTALGLTLVFGIARFVPDDRELTRGWVGMIGLILTLHFGGFHLLSCAWRAAGVRAVPLMEAPLLASGLTDFWGRRWNRAFRDAAHRFLFRPLAGRLGAGTASAAVFLASGLVHDLVISVPARGGYGGPTVFFLIQGVGAALERTRPARRLGLQRGLRGWVFAVAVLLLPLPLLFHPPFVREIILPFLEVMRAL